VNFAQRTSAVAFAVLRTAGGYEQAPPLRRYPADGHAVLMQLLALLRELGVVAVAQAPSSPIDEELQRCDAHIYVQRIQQDQGGVRVTRRSNARSCS
jgi:hypothetical protein